MSEQVRGRGVITPLAVYISHGETEGKGEGESAFLFFSGILGDYPAPQPSRITPRVPSGGAWNVPEPSPETLPATESPVALRKTPLKPIVPWERGKMHVEIAKSK